MSTHYKLSQSLPFYGFVLALAQHKQKAIEKARRFHDVYDICDIKLVQLVSVRQGEKDRLILQERSVCKEREQMNGQDVSGEEWNDDNYMHVELNTNASEVEGFTRFGSNKVRDIIQIIQVETGVRLISEHEDDYDEEEDV